MCFMKKDVRASRRYTELWLGEEGVQPCSLLVVNVVLPGQHSYRYRAKAYDACGCSKGCLPSPLNSTGLPWLLPIVGGESVIRRRGSKPWGRTRYLAGV